MRNIFFRTTNSFVCLCTCVSLLCAFPHSIEAAGLSGLGSALLNKDIDASADNLDFVGDNIIATGHVVVRFKGIHITSDKAIINMTNKDIDASGRVTFIQRSTEETKLDYPEYKKLLKDPNTKVTVNSHYMDPTGRQMLKVTIIKEINSWTGEHAVGNLATGHIDLGKFVGRYDKYYVLGKHGERLPGGKILIKDAKVTTCEYVLDKHEHYSVTATSVELIPKKSGRTQNYYSDKGNYHMLVWNAVLKVGDVPIFYFPFLYKPPDDSLGLGIQVRGGKDSDWGYYVLTKKTFKVLDYPNTEVTLMADYYSKRGPAGGVAINSRTDSSVTDFSIYGVHDKEYKHLRKGRFDYNQNRYEIYASHVQHITPRLDLRAQVDVLSDQNFLHDFFRDKDNANPQPATYVSLEYQFDRLSAGALIRPRVNNFFSVVESLPEVRLDVPRQELFANIYYQGETSFNYRKMNWRHYDYPRARGGQDIKRYETARFDTLHMFYYPFKLAMFNFIPRAGVRLTAYSKTSKKKISDEDLNNYFIVDSPYTDPPGNINNYDSKGGSKVRFAGELGLEVNTKIYRTWNNAKSAFWGVDGLRHVIVPYMNYNYIPNPSLNRDHIYYFDDIDRISEQNFLRVGVKNRLETRRGDYGDQEVYTWASVEHYLDFHFNNEKNFNTVGDFGTIFKFNPTPNFSSTLDMLFDVGNTQLNRIDLRFDYDINEDWKVFMGYYYQNEYQQRSVYSMGSSLTDITSGSSFSRYFGESQSIYGGINFPIFSKTRCEVAAYYDIYNNQFTEGRVKLVRQLHCWEVGLEYRARQRNDDMGDNTWEQSLMISLALTALPSVKINARQSAGGNGPNN